MFFKFVALFTSLCLGINILPFPLYAGLMLAPPSYNQLLEKELGGNFTDKPEPEPQTTWTMLEHPVYALKDSEQYDDIVIKELAKKQGVSVDDLEADFERTVTMLEERIQYNGFIQPGADIIAQKIHEIFDRLIKVYQTQTKEQPGSFHVVDANMVNAFVIRKRTNVYFYKGLYEALYDISTRMKAPLTEDMIAFIIAHELSHALQHTSHQGLDVRDLNESVSPYLVQMIKNGEYDADMRALELMDKAGYSVFGAVDTMTFFEFITRTSQAENVLSSHPYVSLRKHRLSQIIFDQKTNVFTNVKASRTPMVGSGRMKSRDVDFRYLMDKTEQDLREMVQHDNSITALDELTGMFLIRKRMNALRTLVKSDSRQTSFLRHVYMQAVLSAIFDSTSISVMPNSINYHSMQAAAAIYDFGIQQVTENIYQEPKDKFKENFEDTIQKINKSLSYFSADKVVAAGKLFKKLLSAVNKISAELNQGDFDSFLHPLEEVKDLIPLFTKGVYLRGMSLEEGKETPADQKLLKKGIKEPLRLISAFLYANYLGQVPSLEFGIPTTDIRVRLYRRKNYLYLENPAYRNIQSSDERKRLQDIVFLHYVTKKMSKNVLSSNLNDTYPEIGELSGVSLDDACAIFNKYYSVFKEKYPKPIAIRLAEKRIFDYLGVAISSLKYRQDLSSVLKGDGTPVGFIEKVSYVRKHAESTYTGDRSDLKAFDAYVNKKTNEFIDSHPLIKFIWDAIQKYSDRLPKENVNDFNKTIDHLREYKTSYVTEINLTDILTDITRIYSQEPRRETEASAVFSSETTFDYYLKEDNITSLKLLLVLPDWAVSDYLNREEYSSNRLIKDALEEGVPISDIFTFMRSRLGYDDRRKVFKNLFFGYGEESEYLYNFFKSTLNNNPQEIILWFLGMFSKKDGLELMGKFCQEHLYQKAKETENKTEAKELRGLTINLLEYIYSKTSNSFHPDEESVKVYFDLINDRIEESGQKGDEDYMRETVHNALMILSASVDLEIEFSCSDEMSKNGSPDFKSEKTNILPVQFSGEYASYDSKCALHNFAWNDNKSSKQSVFVTYLTDLSVEQLKQLLKQRQKYIRSQADVEYRGEVLSLSGLDDYFANLVTLILFHKMHDPQWEHSKKNIDRLDDLIDLEVSFNREKKVIKVLNTHQKLKKNQQNINDILYLLIKDNLIGTAIPSGFLDPVWESYVTENELHGNFPDIIPLLQNPNVGNECLYDPIAFIKRYDYGRKVSYRQIASKFFKDSSVYATLFNKYCELYGKGYAYGTYKSLEERLQWTENVLPNKSIIKDSIIDLWETDIFPEIIDGLPAIVKLARQASEGWDEFGDMWALLGEMDDDVGRLKRLNDQIRLSPERIYALLIFYENVIPLVLSPQKIARYGATAYMLWKQLPENADFGLSENLDALTKFMPEPSVLRDEMLMRIANKYIRHLEDVPHVSGKLYANNLLSRNKDLRTEDFVSETLLHLFGAAKIEEKRDILLWIVGARDKPQFVVDVENEYSIDFTTLPDDVKLLPATMREKFIEGFMLGDNGVLDPQSDTDRGIMSDFLEQLFLYIFPENMAGIGNETRVLISRIFLVVMKSFPPYRRVQVIKALAALRVRPDFDRTSIGERLAVLLGAMGPVGIKVAQYLSENETLVPDESIRSSLGALRNKAPEITKISACSVLENEVPLPEVLVREIGDPAGIASIKQVNRGKWLDIIALAELVLKKAPHMDANNIRQKIRAYSKKDITFAEFVSYIVEKARHYNMNFEEATASVVFKIRRPNIETTLGIDFAALDAVAQELEGATHKGEALNISDLVQTVKEWVILEQYFQNEVKFHAMLTELDYTWAEDLAKQAGVTISHPRILYATDSLIVEEDIKGVPILNLAQRQQPITMEDVIHAGYSHAEAEKVFNRLAAVEPRQAHITLSLKKAGFSEDSLDELTSKMLAYDYEKLRELLRHMLLHQIFIDGIFHADLHQGNVLITPDGRLVMIDRGNVGRLNKKQIEGAKILLKGLSLREKELIKQGIDLMFLNAQYPEDVEPIMSSITVDDIQEILDKGYDQKMTMNMVSARAVQGAKNTPGGKDFSTFLKAFTQAMYLFPTDLSNGMATLRAIAHYISMSEEEAIQAAREQAKYFVVKDIDKGTGKTKAQESDIMQITKKVFYEKTDRFFLRFLRRPILFRIMAIPVRMIVSKAPSMRSNMMVIVKVYVRQFIEKNIDQFIERQDWDIIDAAQDIISARDVERFLTEYVKRSMKKRFGSRLYAPVVTFLFKTVLFMTRPFTKIYLEAMGRWMDTTGKQYMANIAPSMTVKEGIILLSQLFPENFRDLRVKFDTRREKIHPDSTSSVPSAIPMGKPRKNISGSSSPSMTSH